MTFSSYLTGVLKMIYTGWRPYWVDPSINPEYCEGGWGNPSGHALCTTAVYLTLWRLFFQDKKHKNKHTQKRIWLFFTILFVSMICLSRLILGVHTLNQVISGASIGLGIYYLIY